MDLLPDLDLNTPAIQAEVALQKQDNGSVSSGRTENWAEDEEDSAEGFLDASEDVFGSGMTTTTLGIREDFKQEELEKGKGKGRKGKGKSGRRFFRSGNKGRGKRKGKRHLAEDESFTGLSMTGKGMKQRIGVKAIGPMKMRQHGNRKDGMNGKKIAMMSIRIPFFLTAMGVDDGSFP